MKSKSNAVNYFLALAVTVAGALPAAERCTAETAPNLLLSSGPFCRYSYVSAQDERYRPADWKMDGFAWARISNGVFHAGGGAGRGSLLQGVVQPDPGGRYVVEVSLWCDTDQAAEMIVGSIGSNAPAVPVICFIPPVWQRKSAAEWACIPVSGAAGEWRHVRRNFTVENAAAGFNLEIRFPPGAAVAVSNVALYPDLSAGAPNDRLVLENAGNPAPAAAIFLGAAEAAPVKQAGYLLRRHLHQLTGSLLPVLPPAAGAAAQPGGIYLGRAALEAGVVPSNEMDGIGRSGYVIKSDAGRVGIAGENAAGVLSGVYNLLERLGLRYYLPDLFKVENRDVYCVPALLEKKTPAFEVLSSRASGRWQNWTDKWLTCLGYTDENVVMGSFNVNDAIYACVHLMPHLVPHENYLETHPEYYARDEAGQVKLHRVPSGAFPYVPTYLHLCLSNPEVRRLAAASVLEWMDRQPERRIFTVSQGDMPYFCDCDACRKMDPRPGHYADRHLQFVNYIARAVREKHPDKRLCVLAYYHATSEPPSYTHPEPNVDVFYCAYADVWRCRLHAFCKYNWNGIRQLNAWLRLMDNVYVFDYPWNVYADVDRLKYFAAVGVKGYFTCGWRGEFQDLQTYLIGRLQWEIEMDVEAAVNEFMEQYYGAAAEHMRAYLDLYQDAIAMEQTHRVYESGHNKTPMWAPFWPESRSVITPEIADRAYIFLEQALAAAGTNSAVVDRINLERYDLLMVDLTKRNPRALGLDHAGQAGFAGRLAGFLRLAEKRELGHTWYTGAIGATRVFHNTPIKRWLFEISGLTLTNANEQWMDDQAVRRLLSDPAAALAAIPTQQAVSNGWEILPAGLNGGLSHEDKDGRICLYLRPESSGQQRAWAQLVIDNLIPGAYMIELEALDNDKPMTAELELAVNEQVIFKGPAPFRKDGVMPHRFALPPGVLRAGINRLELNNLTGDDAWLDWQRGRGDELDDASAALEALRLKIQKYNWGWLLIRKISIVRQPEN